MKAPRKSCQNHIFLDSAISIARAWEIRERQGARGGYGCYPASILIPNGSHPDITEHMLRTRIELGIVQDSAILC